MFLTKLAVKNLIRHRRRTLITAMIIAWAIFFYIFIDSMLVGMNEMAYENIIDFESGHMQIAAEEYREEKEKLPLDNLFAPDQAVLAEIRGVKGFEGLSPQLDFQARLNNGVNELPVVARGIDPEQVNGVLTLEDQFTSGSFFQKGEYRVVMGQKLAELMELNTGDYITLLFRDQNDTFNTIDAEISGLLHTADPAVNQGVVYLPLDLAQQALNVGSRVGEVLVRLEDKDLVNEAARELSAGLNAGQSGESAAAGSQLGVYTWQELEAVSITAAKQSSNQLILVIILMIAAIAIINTVILAALERLEEIGMMKAMGLQVKEIVYTFMLESVGIGFLGGVIGTLIGAAGVWYLTAFGIDFAALVNMDMGSFGIPVLDVFYGAWHLPAFIMVFSFGILVALLASILPAYWAARKDPVEAIYHR